MEEGKHKPKPTFYSDGAVNTNIKNFVSYLQH